MHYIKMLDKVSIKIKRTFDSINSKENLKLDLAILVLFQLLYALIILYFPYYNYGWPSSPDAKVYADMALGKTVSGTFSNRILVPFLVSLLPNEFHYFGFLFLTLLGLNLSVLFLYLLLTTLDLKRTTRLIGSLIWIGSYGYTMHLQNMGLVDPLILAVFVGFFYFLYSEKYYYLIPLMWIGIFIKEVSIILIPVIVIEYVFKKKKEIIIYGLISSSVPIIYYVLFVQKRVFSLEAIEFIFQYQSIPTSPIYLTIVAFIAVILLNLGYPFGIILLSACKHLLKSDWKVRLEFLVLSGAVFAFLIFVSGWMRMLFYLFPLIISVGVKELDKEYSSPQKYLLISLLITAWIVIGLASWLIPTWFKEIHWIIASIIFLTFGIILLMLNRSGKISGNEKVPN